ncbi:MAG: hypothetical protein KC609_08155, partial [Myxococcales bacterium]|nr:hypothetical protein [Myxococcales bacterium]
MKRITVSIAAIVVSFVVAAAAYAAPQNHDEHEHAPLLAQQQNQPNDPNQAPAPMPNDPNQPPLEMQGKSYQFHHFHPVPYYAGGGFCYIEGKHTHFYAPLYTEFYKNVGGEYYFTGDPAFHGYVGDLYYFKGRHPIPNQYAGGACVISEPHRHFYKPASTNQYQVVNGYYVYNGPTLHVDTSAAPISLVTYYRGPIYAPLHISASYVPPRPYVSYRVSTYPVYWRPYVLIQHRLTIPHFRVGYYGRYRPTYVVYHNRYHRHYTYRTIYHRNHYYYRPGRHYVHRPGIVRYPGRTTVIHRPGRTFVHRPGRTTVIHRPGRTVINRPGYNYGHRPGRTVIRTPGRTIVHRPGRTVIHRPGNTYVHRPGRTVVHRPGRTVIRTPGRTIVHRP